MNVKEQIKQFIAGQSEHKAKDLQVLHKRMLQILPGCKLWFEDGKDSENKTVSNPTIGYGLYTIKYANGAFREFFQIGLSTNTTGISVYIMGIKDKAYLVNNFGAAIGKAKVTGYCIKFKTLKDINLAVLESAILFGIKCSLLD